VIWKAIIVGWMWKLHQLWKPVIDLEDYCKQSIYIAPILVKILLQIYIYIMLNYQSRSCNNSYLIIYDDYHVNLYFCKFLMCSEDYNSTLFMLWHSNIVLYLIKLIICQRARSESRSAHVLRMLASSICFISLTLL